MARRSAQKDGAVGLPRKRLVGQITAAERDEIRGLFERKSALVELARSLTETSPLYEKILSDLGPVSVEFSQWWTQKGAKYQWERAPTGRWEIDFETREIFLSE